MKKKAARTLLTALCAAAVVTIAPCTAPAVEAEAATVKLAGGTSVDAVPVAGTVASGCTGTLLLLNTEIGQFRIVLDTNTQYGTTQYLNEGAIILCDIYAGSDGQFHAADIQINSDNTKKTGSVAVGTSVASSASSSSSTSTSTTVTQNTVRVYGTVDDDTTTDLLTLVTSDGTMQITLDDSTDMSDGKVLIPGYAYNVDIYRGTGTYNHAAKVIDTSGNNVYSNSGVDSTHTVTITGTVLSGTVQNVLYLSTSGGNMTIRIDSGTDTTSCHVLKEGQSVTATVAGSSDGYLHATKLVDNTAKSVTEGSMGDAGMLTGQNTVTVQGTVLDSSTDDVMDLSVDGETMKLRLDSGSVGTNISAIVPGYSYSVSLYLGTDGYNHVSMITNLSGDDAGGGSGINKNSTQTFTGTVLDGTTCAKLLLKDSSGSTVQIKLDTTTDTSKGRILRTGRTIKVVCAHGYDGYWHATSIIRQ